jgi:hypothetical protein
MSPPRATSRQTIDLGQRLAADRHLQAEIDKGLASLAENPPPIVAQRIARVLNVVLEPSWSEHADFQDEALFPIIAKSKDTTLTTRALLNRLSREHAEIGARHRGITIILSNFIAGRPADGVAAILTEVVGLRCRHQETESALNGMLPDILGTADRHALDRWAATRDAPSFPVNLILDLWD